MAKEIFITENEKAIEQAFLFFPRDVISRKQISEINPDEVTDVILDGNDTEILDVFTRAKKRYMPNGLDFNENIDTLNTSFTKGCCVYETPAPKPHTVDDDYLTGDSFPIANNQSPGQDSDGFDDMIDDELSMQEQIAILQPMLDNKKIGEGTVAELTMKVVDLCQQNKLFERDVITGLFRTVFSKKPLISAMRAEMLFNLHFCDKLAIRNASYKINKETGEPEKDTKFRIIKPNELKLLWQAVSAYSTFNSRKEFYDAIPQWDGEDRINVFMKQYFNCDTNPNFFMLLMTCLVAKFSPRNDYCPYFFDIVASSKGIGKSFLCKRLLGGQYCGFLNFAVGRRDDFYVNAYDGNNAIVVDDECTWVSSTKSFGKISPDELKSIVTTPTDKFSRKYGQPEEHERSFIILRTSNDVNQVYSTNERRQIIFQCNLPDYECRIKDLPDEYFQQMLAQAKVYYIRHHGIYQLTDNDRLEVKDANLENYNWETKENYAILDYIKAVREEPDKYGVKLKAQKFGCELWGGHKPYNTWCDEHKKPALPARAFWRAVTALAELPENNIVVISTTKYDIAGGGCARVFRIDPIKTAEEQELDDIPDIPY
jgi:hypothetical protein